MEHLAPKLTVVFHRQQNVEQGDFSTLLEAYNPELMTKEGLRFYRGTLKILFDGYRDENRLPFLIPEIRRFVRQMKSAWPYAAYFCDFENDYMAIETASHVDHLSVLQREGQTDFDLWICDEELQKCVEQGLRTIRVLGKRAELTSNQIRERQRRCSEYIRIRLG